MAGAMIVVSIQVGRTREYAADASRGAAGTAWSSAIVKEPVAGPVNVGLTNIEGDQQTDLRFHGGVDKAVLAYAASHYAKWKVDLPQMDFPRGAFGENLTIEGLDESLCCVGDVFAVGGCELQISQPRQPCWKLSRRWNLSELAAIVQKTGRTGWYYRVLKPGMIEPGCEIRLLDRPFPKFTVTYAHHVMHSKQRNPQQDLELAECPALSASWKETLFERAKRRRSPM